MEQRRIVLLGKTGSGKSATGNTILQSRYFGVKSSPVSVTSRCNMKEVEHIKVIDTPGMFDTSMTPDQLKGEISRCVSMSVPGPHVFLLVIRLGRFTEEEKNAVRWIQENFGEDASLYTMVLFTHVDQLGERRLGDFLAESLELRRILNTCGNRYHAFNNNDPNPSQVKNLMLKINEMVMMNGGKFYTNEMYENAQRTYIGKILGAAAAGVAGVAARGVRAAAATVGVRTAADVRTAAVAAVVIAVVAVVVGPGPALVITAVAGAVARGIRAAAATVCVHTAAVVRTAAVIAVVIAVAPVEFQGLALIIAGAAIAVRYKSLHVNKT